MPKQGHHPIQKLTASFVRHAKVPGRFADGNCLYLVVEPSGSKRWVARLVVQGRRTDMGLGSARLVSLAEARERALDARRAARSGRDPLGERRALRRRTPTFREASERLHQEQLPTFRNDKHAAQWVQVLRTYCYPLIGDRALDALTTADILAVLKPIWLEKPETARRTKQRIIKVLDWAKAHGYVSGDNAAENVHDVLPRQPQQSGNHEAIHYAEIPKFVSELRSGSGSEATTLGLELIILTALRTNEVQGGRWEEVDWTSRLWSIPPARQLKKRRPEPHVVPLAPRCIEILRRLKGIAGDSPFIFPGSHPERPVSNMTFLMAMRRLGRTETVHGFRSTFRTWVDEKTDHSSDVAEFALAHTIKNKVEAAYRRGAMLEKRRVLMEDWAEYVTSGLNKPQKEHNGLSS